MHKHSHWIFRRNNGDISTHTSYINCRVMPILVEPAMARLLNKRPNLGILNPRFGSGSRYALQTSSPDTAGRLTICFKRRFLFKIPMAHRCSIFLFGTIFCLWSAPAIGNLPHFEALLPPISCPLFYHGHSYFALATWGGVKIRFCKFIRAESTDTGCCKWQQKAGIHACMCK